MSSDGPRTDEVDEAMTALFGVGIPLVNDSSRRILETLYDKAFNAGLTRAGGKPCRANSGVQG